MLNRARTVRAIDVHCHPMTREWFDAFSTFTPALSRLVHRELTAKTPEEMADDFRRDDVLATMIAWDAESATTEGIISNDWLASLSRDFPDVFLPGWAVVDPWKGKAAVREAERALTELGLCGLKFMPLVQAFALNDRRFDPLWDLCQSLGKPVLIHTGTTGLGAGEPGGLGIELEYGRPIPYLDSVAARFPRLTIVAAHPAWPWTDDLIAVLVHKANVVFDISGWRPKYLPEQLRREINGRLQDRALFGSDYPGWRAGECLDELASMGFRDGVIEKLFAQNAVRVLDLEPTLARLDIAIGRP